MVAYLDQAGVQHLITKIRDVFWPVGTILATSANTSPASYIGGSQEPPIYYIERITSMHWIEMIVTIIGSVFTSSGLWTLILYKSKQKDTEVLMTRGMVHYQIIDEGQKFIERGWITHEEYDNFMKYLGDPYLESGSNGMAKKIINDVSNLPFKSISSVHSTMDH